MQRVASIVVGIVLLWCLASCGSNDDAPAAPPVPNESELVGTWKGALDLPEGGVCIESCERSLTFLSNHTFTSSDACPGYDGTWQVRSDGLITLTKSHKSYAAEDGTMSCAAGSTFKPDRAVLNGGRLEVPFDDETEIRLDKVGAD